MLFDIFDQFQLLSCFPEVIFVGHYSLYDHWLKPHEKQLFWVSPERLGQLNICKPNAVPVTAQSTIEQREQNKYRKREMQSAGI